MITPSINKMNFPQAFGKCLGLEVKKSLKKPSVYMEPKSETILSYARKMLPLCGVLEMDQSGYVFLKLPDEYIFDLYNLLQKKETDPPPYFGNRQGAHISVVLPSEKKNVLFPKQLHESIDFTITGCYFTEPRNLEEIKYVWFLTVESSGLEAIRKQLGLSAKILDEEFYITFAMQKHFMSFSDILASENTTLSLKSEQIIQNKLRFLKDYSSN